VRAGICSTGAICPRLLQRSRRRGPGDVRQRVGTTIAQQLSLERMAVARCAVRAPLQEARGAGAGQSGEASVGRGSTARPIQGKGPGTQSRAFRVCHELYRDLQR